MWLDGLMLGLGNIKFIDRFDLDNKIKALKLISERNIVIILAKVV
jgi:hypothetical protein